MATQILHLVAIIYLQIHSHDDETPIVMSKSPCFTMFGSAQPSFWNVFYINLTVHSPSGETMAMFCRGIGSTRWGLFEIIG